MSSLGGIEDGGDGVGEWGVVLPLRSPFRPGCREGREGSSSGFFIDLCFSGRPWRRGEKLVGEGVPLLVLVLVVVLSDVSALAGRGGEGGGVCRSLGGVDGGPRRRCAGGKMGGAEEFVLWPWSFIEFRVRRGAADGSCGRLQGVVVLPPRRRVVRRLRRWLGVLGARWRI